MAWPRLDAEGAIGPPVSDASLLPPAVPPVPRCETRSRTRPGRLPAPVSGTSRNLLWRQLRARSRTCRRATSRLRRPRRTTRLRPRPSRPSQASQAPPRLQCQPRLSPPNPGSLPVPAAWMPSSPSRQASSRMRASRRPSCRSPPLRSHAAAHRPPSRPTGPATAWRPRWGAPVQGLAVVAATCAFEGETPLVTAIAA